MKIILKYILTNIKERKLRTAVIFLSILLSSMLLFVSFPSVLPMKVHSKNGQGHGGQRSSLCKSGQWGN